MGQRIKRFYFVPRDPPQVGFESRVMGDYPARFGEHFIVCVGEWKPLLSSKKEAALPTAESPLLDLVKVPKVQNEALKKEGQGKAQCAWCKWLFFFMIDQSEWRPSLRT